MTSSWSDHVRIDPALEVTLQLFSANFSLILGVLLRGRRSIW